MSAIAHVVIDIVDPRLRGDDKVLVPPFRCATMGLL
jgi:hypothetical protein